MNLCLRCISGCYALGKEFSEWEFKQLGLRGKLVESQDEPFLPSGTALSLLKHTETGYT